MRKALGALDFEPSLSLLFKSLLANGSIGATSGATSGFLCFFYWYSELQSALLVCKADGKKGCPLRALEILQDCAYVVLDRRQLDGPNC